MIDNNQVYVKRKLSTKAKINKFNNSEIKEINIGKQEQVIMPVKQEEEINIGKQEQVIMPVKQEEEMNNVKEESKQQQESCLIEINMQELQPCILPEDDTKKNKMKNYLTFRTTNSIDNFKNKKNMCHIL